MHSVNFGVNGQEYAAKMVDMGVEGDDLLAIGDLTDDEARDILSEIGIVAPLHQRKILREIGYCKAQPAPPSPI